MGTAQAHKMFTKTQRKLMIGYIAFVIVAILIWHGGFARHTSTPLDLILGAPIPFSFGVFAIQNGWISTRYSSPIDRDTAPVSFWFYTALALGLGAGIFLWGVSDALRSMQ
jgi:hypothetical protein